MVFCCFSDRPPAEVKARGATGARYNALLDKQDNPNDFAVGLKDACCKDPCCCVFSMGGMCLGMTACYFRKSVLEKFGRGIEDYVCLQGYVPKVCCIPVGDMCQGNGLALCCEGCCCPSLSLSIARMHMMDAKQIRPDPMDWQIIAFSNCLQLLSCICDILACFCEDLEDLAEIIDCVADAVACSVSGCMGAQINYELKKTGASMASMGVPAPGAQNMQRGAGMM